MAALEAKGFVSRVPGLPSRFAPVPPDLAIGGLVERGQAELDRLRVAAIELQEEFRRGISAASTVDLVEVVRGADGFAQRYLQLTRSATTEVLELESPPYVTPIARCRDVKHDRLALGVRYRVIYAREALRTPGTMALVEDAADRGEDARILTEIPLKLVIADRRFALIPFALEPGAEAGLFIHKSPLLTALTSFFDVLWERALPLRIRSIKPAKDAASNGSPLDEPLLTLMAAGFHDKEIARELGVAPRTVARRVSRLLSALGAETRFQGGIEAERLGLLERQE